MSERQQSPIDPVVQRILDEEQAKDKRVSEARHAFREDETRILRAKTAWLRVASFWGNAIPHGRSGEPLWRRYAELIVELGQVLRADGWYEAAEITPGPPAKQIAVEILRQAGYGEIDNVTALVKAFEDTRNTVGPDSDNWLRVGLMYEFLPIEPPSAVDAAEEPMPDDPLSPPADDGRFLERLKQAAENPRLRELREQDRACRVEAAMYVGSRDEVELACRVEAAVRAKENKAATKTRRRKRGRKKKTTAHAATVPTPKKGGRPRSAEVEEVQAYLYGRWIEGHKLAAIRAGAKAKFGEDRAPKEDSHVTDGAQRYARKHGLPLSRKT